MGNHKGHFEKRLETAIPFVRVYVGLVYRSRRYTDDAQADQGLRVRRIAALVLECEFALDDFIDGAFARAS